MKKLPILLVFCFMVSLTVLGKYVVKDLKHKHKRKSSYRPLPLEEVKEEKPFVVVIPSFNNEAYVEENLRSLFEQKYTNYRVIYIDDASTDRTYEKAKACIEKYQKQESVTLISNVKNQKTLYNLYYAIHSMDNDEIAVILDGDDRLSHPGVLAEVNRYYNDENVWMTYGQHILYPSFEKGMCRETFFQALSRGKIRKPSFLSRDETEWLFSHLRTFYAGLFKRILLRDLLYKGEFYASAADLATMLPMLEMARDHAVYIPKVLYIYNRETPLNDDKVRVGEQVSLNHHIRSLPPYMKLEESPKKPIMYNKTAALCLFSLDRPIQLYSFLESLSRNGSGLDQVVVFYQYTDPAFEEGYKKVQEKFPKHQYIQKSPSKRELIPFLQDLKADYVVMTDDKRIIKDQMPVKEALELLEKTGADAFYFQLGLHIQHLPERILPIGGGSFLWEESLGQNDWDARSFFDMTLYAKNDFISFLKKQTFSSLSELAHVYRSKSKDKVRFGLCYKDSRVVTTPLRVTKVDTGEELSLYTPQELNERFLGGEKIDISPLIHIQNKSTKVEYYPRFLPIHP